MAWSGGQCWALCEGRGGGWCSRGSGRGAASGAAGLRWGSRSAVTGVRRTWQPAKEITSSSPQEPCKKDLRLVPRTDPWGTKKPAGEPQNGACHSVVLRGSLSSSEVDELTPGAPERTRWPDVYHL